MATTIFRWLHITDLHCGQPLQDSRLQNITQYLLDGLPEVLSGCGQPLDAVIFTGDLAFSGTPAQFDKVNELLQKIYDRLERLGSPSPVLLTVPGNHDAVRPSAPEKVLETITAIENSAGKDPNRLSLERGPLAALFPEVTKAFANYQAWYERHRFPRPNNLSPGVLPGDFSATLTKNGITLGILGLNTSLLQIVSGDFEGRLMIFEEQFDKACNGNGPNWAANHDACLLLTHQPTRWLEEDSKLHMIREVAVPGRFAVHLYGHTHEHEIFATSTGGGKPSVSFEGISLFGWEPSSTGKTEPDRRHGFSLGSLNISGSKGTFTAWPRVTCRAADGHLFLGQDSKLEYVDGHLRPVEVSIHPRLQPIEKLSQRGLGSWSKYELTAAETNPFQHITREIEVLVSRYQDPRQSAAARELLEDCLQSLRKIDVGELPIIGQEAAFFRHWLERARSYHAHQSVLAYIRLAAFKPDDLIIKNWFEDFYRNLSEMVHSGQLTIRYIYLLPTEIVTEPTKTYFQKIERFAEEIRVIGVDCRHLNPGDLRPSIVLFEDQKFAFTHDRADNASMLQAWEWITDSDYQRLHKTYQKLKLGSTVIFKREKIKSD